MEIDGEYLLQLQASQPSAQVVGSDASGQNLSDEQREIEQRAVQDTAARVAGINQKVSTWVYAISEQKYAAMSTQTEDVLKPLESP